MVVASTGEHLQFAIVVLIACFPAASIKRQVVIYTYEWVLGQCHCIFLLRFGANTNPKPSSHFLTVRYVNSSLSVSIVPCYNFHTLALLSATSPARVTTPICPDRNVVSLKLLMSCLLTYKSI